MAPERPTLRWTETGDEAVAETVLRALPDWFGIEDALSGYVAASGRLPTVTARLGGEAVGFASIGPVTPGTAEIHVIGVPPSHHRLGVGRRMVAAVLARCRGTGVRLLTVKTLGAASGDPFYERTRRFYDAVGFAPAAELPDLWGPGAPCLALAMPVPEDRTGWTNRDPLSDAPPPPSPGPPP